MIDNQYISLEKVAGQLNLPQKFIREQSKAGKIPHLVVGGRLRYQLKSVRESLNRIEQERIKTKQQTIISQEVKCLTGS